MEFHLPQEPPLLVALLLPLVFPLLVEYRTARNLMLKARIIVGVNKE